MEKLLMVGEVQNQITFQNMGLKLVDGTIHLKHDKTKDFKSSGSIVTKENLTTSSWKLTLCLKKEVIVVSNILSMT